MTGALVIDLTHEPDRFQEGIERKKIAEVDYLPNNARVIVQIGDRPFLDWETIHRLHQHAERLSIDIHGTDAAAVVRVVTDIRIGDSFGDVG